VKKRILFVDDEPAILSGIRNLLRKDQTRWEMTFALGGQQALDELRKERFDVVVSDMRMPGIDGATLLHAVNDESPTTARILLTGYADDASLTRLQPLIHKLLSKPCNAATLRKAIEQVVDGNNDTSREHGAASRRTRKITVRK
jgi:YesN/AraC family two-component response regulator